MMQVLIAEDDHQVAETFQTILHYNGFSTKVAGSVKASLTELLLKRRGGLPPFDAILLDVQLPNGRGLEVIRKFVWAFADVPLVIVTGDSSLDVNAAIQAGAEAVLFKPVEAGILVGSIQQAIKRHQVRGIFKPVEEEIRWQKEQEQTFQEYLRSLQAEIEESQRRSESSSVEVNLVKES